MCRGLHVCRGHSFTFPIVIQRALLAITYSGITTAAAPLPIQPPSQPGNYIFCYLVCSIIILLGISNSYHYLMYHSFCWTILGCHRKTLKDYPNQANSSAGTKVEILDFSDPTKNAPCLMIYIHPDLLSVQEGF